MTTVGLVLPASSYRGSDFVAAADELGIDLVIATDGDLPVAGGRISRVVPIDCGASDDAVATIVQAASENLLDAVVGVDDAGVLIAAGVAGALDLVHDSIESVAATRDKAEMRRLLQESGVPQARHALVASAADAVAAADEIGYPVVLKPRTLSGSRGVIRADDASSLEATFRRVAAIAEEASASTPFVLEEYLPGAEVAVEALATPSGVEVLAVFDKPDPLEGPFFEETIYIAPSQHDPEVLAGVERLVESGVAAIGLVHGPVHAEVRLTPDGPRLVEVAARSIGGLCGRTLRFGMLGQSLEVLLLRAALGLNRKGMGRQQRPAGVMMLPSPTEGILREIRGQAAVFEVEGITDLQVTIAPGRRIRPLPEGDRYLGFLFASADSPAEVESALREAQGLLDVVLD